MAPRLDKRPPGLDTQPEVVLVLGSGGVRGIAHIGVLKELLQAGVRISRITGCSAGAIVGALFADGKEPEEIYELFCQCTPAGYDYSFFGAPSIRSGLLGWGFFSMERLRRILTTHLRATHFEELNIPLQVVATDLRYGRLHAFSRGKLADPICASAAIPGLFQPIPIGDSYYVDGGVLCQLPIHIAKQTGGGLVVAVNVPAHLDTRERLESCNAFARSYTIFSYAVAERESQEADIVITPQLQGVGSLFGEKRVCRYLYEEGRKAARKVLPFLLERLTPPSAPSSRRKRPRL